MMEYELIKYKYGRVVKYTAFEIRPIPREGQRGRRLEGTVKLVSRHWQRRSTAEAWCIANKVDSAAFDWSLLPGTAEFV